MQEEKGLFLPHGRLCRTSSLGNVEASAAQDMQDTGLRDEDLPPVRLFVDDVEELVHEMTKDEPNLAANLTTDKYELDSPKDLVDPKMRANPPKELHINLIQAPSTNALITVDIRSSGVTLHAEEDNVLSRGILSKASEFLRSKQRRFSSYGENLPQLLALMLAAGLLLFVFSTIPTATGPPPSGPRPL